MEGTKSRFLRDGSPEQGGSAGTFYEFGFAPRFRQMYCKSPAIEKRQEAYRVLSSRFVNVKVFFTVRKDRFGSVGVDVRLGSSQRSPWILEEGGLRSCGS